MTGPRTLATTIHDAIDDVTAAVEDVHKSIADLPLEALGTFAPLERRLDAVREAQARSIAAVYDLIRRANERVRRLTTGRGRPGARRHRAASDGA